MNLKKWPLVGMTALMGLAGCAQTLPYSLRQSLDEVTLTSITPNEQESPNVVVKSNLQDPYIYVAQVDGMGSPLLSWAFPVNATVGADLQDYAHARFPKTLTKGNDPAAPIQVSVTVSTLTATCGVACDTHMQAHVQVTKDSKAMGDKLIDISNEAASLNRALEGNINKVIILLDKYLTSLGI
jgi:hypothetical protein